MVEALAAVGVVASIIQVVDFGDKIVRRLDEYYSNLDEIPKSLQQISTQLPLLLDTLKGTQHAIGTGVIRSDTEKALLPVINGSKVQIELLDAIIHKLLPSSSDSLAKRGKKAWSSLKQDSNVNGITSALGNYVQTLTFYHSVARSTLNPLKGMSFPPRQANLRLIWSN
jgi:N-terminal domain on NACHT_NTPase and P-loop NTPases